MEQLKTYFYSLSISKRIGILVLGILILSLPLVIIVSQQAQDTRQRASELPASPPIPTNYVSLKFNIASATRTIGQMLSVRIYINPFSNQVTGDDIKITFDKNVLELVSFEPISASLKNHLKNDINNTEGIFSHAAVNINNSDLNEPQEEVLIGNLNFKAKAVGTSQVLFQNPQITALNYEGLVPTYNNDSGVYTVVDIPTPTPTPTLKNGDANGDGSVDILDYNIWRDEFLGTAITQRSDFNKDGKIDITDFAIWRNAFNPNPSPTITGIPTVTPTQSPQAYKRVFITSTSYNGNLGGLANADTRCRERAAYISSGNYSDREWKAWLSDSTTSAYSRLNHFNGQYKLVDDSVIANNWDDLIDGRLQHAININELNQFVNTEQTVWTNTSTNGNITSSDKTSGSCNNWTEGTTGTGNAGNSWFAINDWTQGISTTCNIATRRLYCFEQ